MLAVSVGTTGAVTLSTPDRLTLNVNDADGSITSVVVEGRSVSVGRGGFFVADVMKAAEFAPVLGPVDGNGEMTATAASFQVQARYQVSGSFIKVSVKVRNLANDDRGALVYFALPVEAVGWKWWDDQQTSRPIAAGKQYENASGVRAFSGIAETRDVPALKIGMHSKTFVSAVTPQLPLPAGIAFAHSLDELRIFRTGYDAEKRQFYILYELGLSKDSRIPDEGEFSFLITRCSARWGFRDALARYYATFPQLFERRLKRQGIWMPFQDLKEIDNANEFGFAIQEGAPNVAYDDRLNVTDFVYTTGGQLGANVKGYRPGIDPPPSRETVIAAFNDALKGYGAPNLYEQVGVKNSRGELDFKPSIAYFQFDAQADMNPALALGTAEVRNILAYFDRYKKQGAELDGVYYDGIAAGLDYAREHFKAATFPPIFDPVAKMPVLYNYFSSLEFAKAAGERMHSMGKLTMMNGAMSSDFFSAPVLDVLGEETGLTIPRDAFNYVRMMCYRKPFVTLLKGDYGKYTHADIELYMKRCLAYGVFPGFFDWYTSGLGPGSSYWEHPEWYERDRDLFRRYVPLVARLAEAGWEPVTAAATDNGVSVERFGRFEDGSLHLTLLNDSAKSQQVRLEVPTSSSGEIAAFDEIAERPVKCARTREGLQTGLTLPPNEATMLRLGSKADLMRDRAHSIQDILSARKVQVAADTPKSARLVYWNSYGREEMDASERHSGARSFRLAAGDKPQRCGASQWVILHQKRPEKIHVSVWCKTTAVSGGKDNGFAVRILLHHVKDFITTTSKFLPLDPGTHDWQEAKVDLMPDEPVDAVLLLPVMEGRTGAAWVDDLVLTSENLGRENLVHDGGFERWHETLSPQDEAEIARRFDLLGKQAGESKLDLAAMLRGVDEAENWINSRQLQSAAERELRDLADVRRHLTNAALIELGSGGLSLKAPSTVTPGETFEVRITQEKGKPSAAKLTCDSSWRVVAAKDGQTFRVTVPDKADPGEVTALRGEAATRLPAGTTVRLRVSTNVKVLAPFEATLSKVGPARFRVNLGNNTPETKQATVTAAPPTAGSVLPGQVNKAVPGRSHQEVDFEVAMSPEATSGSYPVSVSAACEAKTLSLKSWMLYLPEKANRLGNAGFEDPALVPWSKYEQGATLDEKVFHSGARSLRCEVEQANVSHGANQGVELNQKTATPFLVRGFSKAADVSGTPDDNYSIYVDCYYADGTALYGNNLFFSTGTHDWEYRERLIEPAKPVRSVSVYAMFRNHTGTAWFDDFFLGEFVSRAGNLARGAKVTTDSCFTQYTTAPLTDGITEVAGLDWSVADWASAETPAEHWIELEFAQPTRLSRVNLYWSLDAGVAHPSREYRLQSWDGAAWKDIVHQTDNVDVPMNEHRFAPVETTRLRLLQPVGGGGVPRGNLMWVREVEVY